MRTGFLALPLLLMSGIAFAAPDRAANWWNHVKILADDGMEGRATGTAGYDRAADYVIARLQEIGLKPAGDQGFKQPVAFVEQTILSERSSARLTSANSDVRLHVPGDLIFSGSGGPVPSAIDAPMVFAGYGLHLPEVGYDDFAGLSVKGKIVVVISGGPEEISGALKSHARSERSEWLAQQGAVGIITLVTPKQVEIPWPRRVNIANVPALYFEDAAIRDSQLPFISAQLDPAKSNLLFTGSERNFAAISALADASQPIKGFDLTQRLKATIVAERKPVMGTNIVAVMPGSDPKLKQEYVVLSAHLDGYGISTPVKGDGIYNGALDNASGVASLLEIAKDLKAKNAQPKRSLLFVFVCGEEKGLLGSRYFAKRPTVPLQSMVADLNLDMALPIFPLVAVTPIGFKESSLGGEALAVSAEMNLPIWDDPFPDRNVFTRSDQYSFIRQGIPSLFFKFGFKAGTPEAETEKTWRANIYHSPFDDMHQPVMPEESVKLNDYVSGVALRIANEPKRPTWKEDSFFRRFVK